jgi:hypothetical protein
MLSFLLLTDLKRYAQVTSRLRDISVADLTNPIPGRAPHLCSPQLGRSRIAVSGHHHLKAGVGWIWTLRKWKRQLLGAAFAKHAA